jgi:hypothetical protein
VTKGGTDALLSEEENTAEILEPPTEEEMKNAITHRIRDLVVVVGSPLLSWFSSFCRTLSREFAFNR